MNLETYCNEHGQTSLAVALGVTQGLVWQWLNGRTRITAEKAIEIEKATRGQVSRRDLRPDLYSDPDSDVRCRRQSDPYQEPHG